MVDRQPPRPRAPSKPEIQAAEVDRTVGGAEHQRRFDQPRRKQTMPGGMSAIPVAPPLPLEHAKTVPAAAHVARTQRAPSPIGVQVVSVADAPFGRPAATTLPPASLDPRDAQIASLIRERDARKAKESEPPTPAAWAKLGYRVAAAAAGAVVLVIAALGARAVSMVEAKTDANKAAQQTTKEKLSTRELEWRNWAARVVAVDECRHLAQTALNERQFPASQKAGSAAWPIYKDECGELPRVP